MSLQGGIQRRALKERKWVSFHTNQIARIATEFKFSIFEVVGGTAIWKGSPIQTFRVLSLEARLLFLNDSAHKIRPTLC